MNRYSKHPYNYRAGLPRIDGSLEIPATDGSTFPEQRQVSRLCWFNLHVFLVTLLESVNSSCVCLNYVC